MQNGRSLCQKRPLPHHTPQRETAVILTTKKAQPVWLRLVARRLGKFSVNFAPMQHPLKLDDVCFGIDLYADAVIANANFVVGLKAR
jgi:hypothetical protein